ncbi:MAG: nicotinamide-nucleotide adenylyltransferase [Candidatus Nezhaarchaeales archaeon]|nr:MAG: nicotinamide-nucleotide adenylyltransferase [Candidatus Nezhaarchaeota archaeon WYZ-LMO8]TDA37429.1 MAG: nicotinamide-nucleotide adenylyltransferase [Candidatus Nezhaarchaeota archaeon WYZ-LMO7]
MPFALFIGRFQPYHLGHLAATKWILEREERLIVGIGSAQYSHTFENPFTAGERVEMILATLEEEGLTNRCLIIPIPDIGQHALWVQVVKQYCPSFSRVYTNSPLTRRLFIESGIEVREIPLFMRDKYDATYIRKLMIEGDSWESYVPRPVAEVIKRVKGVERLREIVTRCDKYQ